MLPGVLLHVVLSALGVDRAPDGRSPLNSDMAINEVQYVSIVILLNLMDAQFVPIWQLHQTHVKYLPAARRIKRRLVEQYRRSSRFVGIRQHVDCLRFEFVKERIVIVEPVGHDMFG